jgi:hypothetical protein
MYDHAVLHWEHGRAHKGTDLELDELLHRLVISFVNKRMVSSNFYGYRAMMNLTADRP